MKAIICGAGIAGWTLAWWLDRNGWQVLLVEHAPGPRTGGYMIEQRIRPLVTEKQKAGRSTARWFVPTSQWRISTRRLALAAARIPGATSLLRAALAPLRASLVPADRRTTARAG